MRATRLALAVREKYGVTGVATEDEIDRMIAGEGVILADPYPMKGRLRGVLIDGVIVLRDGLDSGWRRCIKAHELGHHLMHDYNAFYLHQPHREHLKNRVERQAQAFAGALLTGEPFDEETSVRLHDAYEDGIPVDFLFSYFAALNWRPPVDRVGA